MSEFDVVQFIALSGWLILALAALASYKFDWRQGVRMALIWAAIFTGLTLLFTVVGGY